MTGETAIRVLIVDDESLARSRIRAFLEATPGAYAIAEASDGIEALERIPQFDPQITFLDIEMPELDGFGVVRNLSNEQRLRSRVIFQTAYDQFAVNAFEVNACDYLLKPFSDERMAEALKRARQAAQNSAPMNPLAGLETHLASQARFLDKVIIDAGNRSRVVRVEEILNFSSESHTTRVFLANVDYSYGLSLTQLEKSLDPSRFLRVHRNCLLRLDQVATFSNGSPMEITLKNGTVLQASREGGRALRRVLEEST